MKLASLFYWRKRTYRNEFFWFSAAAVLFLMLFACEKDDIFSPDFDPLPDPPPPHETLISSSEEITPGDSAEYLCTIKKISLSENFNEVVVFTPNADVVWPGALVQGNTIQGGTPALIPAARTPATISIDLPVTDNSRTVTNPTFGTVSSAINDLIIKNSIKSLSTPARIFYYEKEAYSREQGMLKIGVSARWLTGSLRGNFEVDRTIGKQTIFVRYVQPYYTVGYEHPGSSELIFDSSVRSEDLANYMGPANPPAYIASVTYGRMFLFKMVSSYSFEEMKRALRIGVNFTLGGGGGNIDQQTRKVLSESETTVLVLGGSAQNGVRLVTTKDIIAFLEGEPGVSEEAPGVPLSYTIKWLKNLHLAKLGDATEYEVRECAVNMQRVEVTIESLYMRDFCEERGGRPPSETYYRFSILPYDDKRQELERIEFLCTTDKIRLYQGDTHNINQSRNFALPKAGGSFFVLRGWIRDVNDDCDAAEFDLEIPHNDGQYGLYNPIMGRHDFEIENWRPGAHQYIFSDGNDCTIDVRYRVTLR